MSHVCVCSRPVSGSYQDSSKHPWPHLGQEKLVELFPTGDAWNLDCTWLHSQMWGAICLRECGEKSTEKVSKDSNAGLTAKAGALWDVFIIWISRSICLATSFGCSVTVQGYAWLRMANFKSFSVTHMLHCASKYMVPWCPMMSHEFPWCLPCLPCPTSSASSFCASLSTRLSVDAAIHQPTKLRHGDMNTSTDLQTPSVSEWAHDEYVIMLSYVIIMFKHWHISTSFDDPREAANHSW